MKRVSDFLNLMAPALGGAMLMLIYLKRVAGMPGLQDTQDGLFALLVLTWAVKFFIERKLQAVPNG